MVVQVENSRAVSVGIESEAGVDSSLSLTGIDPEALRFVVEQSKQAGNEAFKQKKYRGMYLFLIFVRF
jgi:hypothetical protein